jgi:hypothetical protein
MKNPHGGGKNQTIATCIKVPVSINICCLQSPVTPNLQTANKVATKVFIRIV